MSASSFEQTNKSCLNNSSSKHLFSFPKQKRFKEITKPISQTDFLSNSYSDGKLNARSFSRSKRQLLFQNQKQHKLYPPPNIYTINVKQSSPRISMAIKLQTLDLKKKMNLPGPAAYSSRSQDRNNKSLSFTKQKRVLKFPMDNRKGLDAPGPYLIKTQKLKSILSNYNNPRQTKIPKKSNIIQLETIKLKLKAQQQLKKQKMKKKIQNVNPEVVSTLRQSIIFKKEKLTVFDKQRRKSYFDVDNKNPSPNNYQHFSQFSLRKKPDAIMAQKSSKTQAKNTRIKTQRPNFKQRLRTLTVAS